ncbi:MAG: RlmE family RNA methyltransferase [Candidatus Thorarchaeota archaeon]|nr:RlmE family RNA methyltransferase [Candidatus Thorarchaeota archaeon]
MGRPKKPRTKEHYYKSAKAHGYRARSAYKLRQIATKYKLLDGVDKAIELCSSPGGWTQVLLELSHTIQVIAVDLAPMDSIEGTIFIQGDILDSDVIEKIMDTAGGPVDLVLSDCSPKVSGNWDLDVARQLALAEATLEIGLKLLSGNGKVLAKVFQGKGFQEFLQSTREQYRSVRLVKPLASRSTSAEIYLLAIGPKK